MIEGLSLAAEVFLYVFIGGGVLTLLYVLFGDVLDGLFEVGDGLLNPTVILSFVTFFSGTGFILLSTTELTLLWICLFSSVFSFSSVALIYVFILRPVSRAEQSNTYRLDDFIGTDAKLTLGIPIDGLGQVSISRQAGYFSQSAKTTDGTAIPTDTNVRIVGVDDGVFIVEVIEESSLKTT